jgi:uracil-DNA glycosylase
MLEPSRDCPLCPRLVALRGALRLAEPLWWNAPVPALGAADAPLAIVGLAPGRQGANRTGRAFTGDASGDLLFAVLEKFDWQRRACRPAW